MKQMPFADAEYAGKRKQTRRERFLIDGSGGALEDGGRPGLVDHYSWSTMATPTCRISQDASRKARRVFRTSGRRQVPSGSTAPLQGLKETANLFGPYLGFAQHDRCSPSERFIRCRHPICGRHWCL